MRAYHVTLEHITPIMMHRDNLEFKAVVERWQRDPANRDKSVAGDDRSPAWTWIGAVYHDGTAIAIPTDCLMASCMGAGAEVKSRGRRTLKAQTQSGMAFTEPFLRFSANGGSAIAMDAIRAVQGVEEFDQHTGLARDLGFALDVRRCRVGTSKHVRVRPVFDHWRAEGVLNVWDDALTDDALRTVFHLAGDRYGLLEWRPSGRRPGPFGRFKATLAAI